MSDQVVSLMEQAMRLVPSNYAEAIVLLIEAQSRAKVIGDTSLLVRAISNEARVALRRRPVDSVLSRHAEAMRIAQASGLSEARFWALFGVARTWADLRLPQHALAALERAADLVGRAEAEAKRGWLTLQASVMSQCGRVTEADRLYEGLLQHFAQQPDPQVHGTTLNNLAAHHERCGRHAAGLQVSDEAEQLLNQAGAIDTGTRAALVTGRIRLLVGLGRADDALQLVRTWFAEPPQPSPWACGLCLATAEAHLAAGAAVSAEDLNRQALAMALRVAIPRTRDILEQAARIAAAQHREDWAAEMSERAAEEERRFQRLAASYDWG